MSKSSTFQLGGKNKYDVRIVITSLVADRCPNFDSQMIPYLAMGLFEHVPNVSLQRSLGHRDRWM
jgi:hypothetical protein